MEVKRCPKCKKKPVILFDLDFYEAGHGGLVTVECKPLFRKAHFSVEGIMSGDVEQARRAAIEKWNERVEEWEEWGAWGMWGI